MKIKVNAEKKAAIEAELAKRELASSDSDTARILEDLLSALIDSEVIKKDAIPKAAWEKIEARKALRAKIKKKRK